MKGQFIKQITNESIILEQCTDQASKKRAIELSSVEFLQYLKSLDGGYHFIKTYQERLKETKLSWQRIVIILNLICKLKTKH